MQLLLVDFLGRGKRQEHATSFEKKCLFISNLTRVILNFTMLLISTFSFVKFIFIKNLFVFSYLFILYFNTQTKHFNLDSRIYHSYNLIYQFLLFFVILIFININNMTRGFKKKNLD